MPKERVCANSETVSADNDPITPLYQEWCRAHRDWMAVADEPGNGNWDFPESKAAEARSDAAYEEMLGMTPTTLQGIKAFAHLLWSLVGPGSAEGTMGFDEECKLPDAILIAGIWRAAGGEGVHPN